MSQYAWRNKAWPEDLGGRRHVRQAWASHSTMVVHDTALGAEDQSEPAYSHLCKTLSANRERAEAQSRRGTFREVEEAYVKCAKIASGKHRQRISGPPATLALSARLSRNKKAKRGDVDQRAHQSTITRLRHNCSSATACYRGTTTSTVNKPATKGKKGSDDSMWFATLAADTYTVGAQAARGRKPVVHPKPHGPELHGSNETWQEAYTRRYRGVLLSRLMAAEATPTKSLEDLWVEMLSQDKFGSSEPVVQELRGKVIEEFESALLGED